MTRGIIAAPAIINTHADGFTMERTLSPQEIRYYLLYWDKVVIPTTNLIGVGLPEEDILLNCGVVERPLVTFKGTFGGADLGHTFAEAQSVVAEKLMQSEIYIDWVLHQIGNKISIPNEYVEPKNSLRFELVNLLPVPNGAAPIVEILEFKESRKTELDALHECIEHVFIEALSCPDPNLGYSRAIRDLKNSIDNLDSVSSEKWDRIDKFDLATEFNLDGGQLLKGVASGAVIDFFTNPLSLPIGAIIGGIASCLKFKASRSSSFKPASQNSKLAFLSHAHNEQIFRS